MCLVMEKPVIFVILVSLFNGYKSDVLSHLTREICMDSLGCFSAAAPFFDIVERPLSLLPDEREAIKTKFLLYTPLNPHMPKEFSNLKDDIQQTLKSGFNPASTTKFVVPGFMSRTSPGWKKGIVEALILTQGCNVFMVDWSAGDGPLYEQAVANTRVVGAEIALFIKKLEETVKIRPESIHIIGHSLGSHIAGYAGKRLKNLGRITAMDPAGPYFTNVDPVVRLDRNDALFVDAIHTNAAATRFQGFGMLESIAHFDFFPNGGHIQPGCEDMGHAVWSFLTHPSFDAAGLKEIQCNHIRAIRLFISSMSSPCQLDGSFCESWQDFKNGKCAKCGDKNGYPCVPLGMHADVFASLTDKSKSLNFYLNTTATEPFCLK